MAVRKDKSEESESRPLEFHRPHHQPGGFAERVATEEEARTLLANTGTLGSETLFGKTYDKKHLTGPNLTVASIARAA